jgi:hypothetical protein
MVAKFSDAGVVAYRDNFIPANRQRFGPGLPRIQCVDAPVKHHYVRGTLRVLRPGGPNRQQNNAKNHHYEVRSARSHQQLGPPEIKMLAAY